MKKKILFLLHLPPPVHGSSMVGKFIKESIEKNTCWNSYFINLLASTQVKNTGKFTFNKVKKFLLLYLNLIRALFAHKFNGCYFAITVSGMAFYRDLLIVGLLKIFRIKLLFHLHNKGVRSAKKSFIKDYLYRFFFKNAEVILLSDYLYSDIEEYVPKTKISICPNGIPLIESEITSTHQRNSNVNILFLSNLIESKGVIILLEACRILKSKKLTFTCSIVGGEGDISVEQLNQKIQEYDLSEYVNYLGKKYGKEKDAVFRKADVFVFPTYYEKECFPLVLLEAMQYSLPIISTPEGGIPDIVIDGETGFLVPQKNVDLLVAKLLNLIKDDALRKALGKRGKDQFKQRYTLRTFEQRFSEILEKVF